MIAVALTFLTPLKAFSFLDCQGAHLFRKKVPTKRLVFTGVGDHDVYNPTRPFFINGQWTIAARVESRKLETDSKVRFFARNGETWDLIANASDLSLQDPFFTSINGQLVIGGVEVSPRKPPQTGLGYKTVFYSGSTLQSLSRVAEGPPDMKGIRLLQLSSGEIFVLTRPHVGADGRGMIGYTWVRKLSDLNNPSVLTEAPLFYDQFTSEQWGGANEIYELPDGRLGILGHIAEFDQQGRKHYSSMTFTIDLRNRKISPVQVFLKRSNLSEDPEFANLSKRPELQDVLYSGGLEFHDDGTATLYTGVGDTHAVRARIPNPF